MKSNELRVGNYFGYYDDLHGYIIGMKSGAHKDGDVFITTPGGGYTNIYMDSLKPIPLTEEWLTKFGFIKGYQYRKGDFNYWNKEKDCSVDVELTLTDTKVESSYWYRLYEQKRRKHLIYVHELQNLYFALTGKELQTT